MADLLGVDWAAIVPTLKGFSKDGVEWFLHVQVHGGVTDSKSDAFLQFVN